jgi:N-succinyldiaminopimelate aminotransferase
VPTDHDLLSSRLAGFGTTIFAEMSALAVATGSINLGQGFPDTDGPAEIVEAAVAALRAGRGNQYPPGPGIPELRTAVAAHQRRYYGLDYDPDREVLITAGATEALTAALLALIEPGDEVIVLEPHYDSYAAAISMAGGRIVPVHLRPPAFALDLDELAAAVTPRTKVVLVNSPHNPTGTVLSRAELQGIADVVLRHGLTVITDEVYEHLTYDDVTHTPIATLPGMRDRTVSISSAGKTFAFTGWKIGWVTAAPHLVDIVRTAKQFLTYVSGGPFQYAIADALDRVPDSYYEELRKDLGRRRDLLLDGLTGVGFEAYRPDGTYFIMADIRPLGADDGMAFCRSLPARCGVVAVPAGVFYQDPAIGATQIRFAFCKRDAVLRDAIDRLRTLAA